MIMKLKNTLFTALFALALVFGMQQTTFADSPSVGTTRFEPIPLKKSVPTLDRSGFWGRLPAAAPDQAWSG
jgi:hypothetical protein